MFVSPPTARAISAVASSLATTRASCRLRSSACRSRSLTASLSIELNLTPPGGYGGVMSHKLRGIYLNDHFAGSVAGVELARRAAGSNEGTELGDFLAGLAAEIEEDRETLSGVMGALGVSADPVKRSLAWGAEKVGRLKPNGQLLGYSPLSRLVELEGLRIGITGKQALWDSMAATPIPELAEFDFEALSDRAARQLADLEPHRLAAAAEAFAEKAEEASVSS